MKERTDRRIAGFTLIEGVVMLLVLLLIIGLALPQLLYLIRRSRFQAITTETTMLLARARMEAIKRGVPVVVGIDVEQQQLFAFADVNLEDGSRGSDLIFTEVADANPGTTDYRIASIPLPDGVRFWGPDDDEADGPDAIAGFTEVPDEDVPNVAVMQIDGSVRDIGAFRLGFRASDDDPGNFFEVRVSPQATARVQIRKFDRDRTPGPDGMNYYTRDQDGEPWEWNE
jgi:type II secretory pathway pseudopilin PulG